MQWFGKNSSGRDVSTRRNFQECWRFNKCVKRNIAYETYARRDMLTLFPKGYYIPLSGRQWWLGVARRCEVGESPTIAQYRSINIFQEDNL